VKLTIAWIGKTKDRAIQDLTDKYLNRLAHYATIEALSVKDESKLLNLSERKSERHILIALDSQGEQLSSEGLAEFLQNQQNRGSTHLVFAIGGADGHSEDLKNTAAFTLSLGKMTLSHELARVVLLEQLYRAFTILKGHPYHVGH
jgi:23S rRNA (pseudouridine1915-N3)-methyltransferase